MAFTNTRENGFEALIVNWLVEHNGYEEGSNADYNKEYAIDETRLFRFLQDTQPAQMGKLGVFQSEQKKRQFLNRLQGELAKRGIIDVLRNGIKVYPVDLIMFYLTPTENNVKAGKMFERNIFCLSRSGCPTLCLISPTTKKANLMSCPRRNIRLLFMILSLGKKCKW